MRRELPAGATLLALALAASGAHAQSAGASARAYPTKPVRVLVGAPAGSGTDVITRIVSQKLSERWGQTVVVDNRAGAVGAIALELGSQAPPDGYTLSVLSGQNLTAMLLKLIKVDIPKAFTPVVQMTSLPYILLVTPSLPVTSVKELIALAKAKPLIYASSGTGSVVHLGMELYKSMTGVEMTHVPYKGSGQSMIDLMSGRAQVAITNSLTATPLVKSSKLRALAVTTPRRSPAFPQLPTIAEAGVPGYALDSWYGLFTPAGTPAAIVNALNHDVTAVVNAPETREKLAANAADVTPPHTPAQFRKSLDQELERWRRFLSSTNLKLD
jgi:tripartite-type tricarboxylate transporter receptor subunit TctC